jgi:hypothetical protein
MKSEIVRNFPLVELSIIALLIFFAFFVMTWIRTYSAKHTEHFNELSKLPLEEGQPNE